jgi:hypothetical protein
MRRGKLTNQNMKKLIIPSSVFGGVALMALITGCETTSTANNTAVAKSPKQMALTQAGFKTKTITTAKQKQQVQALPGGKVSLAKHNGKTFYVYPDVAHNQVYTGNRAQYKAYKASARTAGINIDPDPHGIAINEFDGWGPGPLASIDGY